MQVIINNNSQVYKSLKPHPHHVHSLMLVASSLLISDLLPLHPSTGQALNQVSGEGAVQDLAHRFSIS